MKNNFYSKASKELRRELGQTLDTEDLRHLHKKNAWSHFFVVFWQISLLTGTSIFLWSQNEWYIVLPLVLIQGFTIFNFTVLLHEVVHEAVFEKKRPFFNRLLGLCYGLPSGISASQFTRWHLDHHNELGSNQDDPKRAHLTPKLNARWYKALYFTPALFPIYFRAAKKENATYPQALRKTIALERTSAITLHLLVPALIWWFSGGTNLAFWQAAKIHLIPVFFVFPVAFAINRLGQHYNIQPDDVAGWSTRMSNSRFWEVAFLFSSYHLEHHYFPNVPFYRLRKLNKLLEPFFDRHGIKARTYRGLLWGYLIGNSKPHTDWDKS